MITDYKAESFYNIKYEYNLLNIAWINFITFCINYWFYSKCGIKQNVKKNIIIQFFYNISLKIIYFKTI
jgi:hypothetical protein